MLVDVPVVLSRGKTPPTLLSTNLMLTFSLKPVTVKGEVEGGEKADDWNTTNMSGPELVTSGTTAPLHMRISVGGRAEPETLI